MTILTTTSTLAITSNAFRPNDFIPSRYTCQGENVNPPLSIENIPPGTRSLVILVEDPDAAGETFDHWITWNIAPVNLIAENTAPGIEGENGFGEVHYKGPCPPTGTHRYFFKVYALDTMLDAKEGADKKTIEHLMESHVLASGELVGQYRKAH
jgi:Raf kinase inhibitor-like YbhB/YbcL family protein